MKRIKSAPANIAEMVNRKKPRHCEPPSSTLAIFTTQQKKLCPLPLKPSKPSKPLNNKVVYSKTQKNIEKTLNNVMLDYLENHKQQFNTNDEEVVIISILYYYICEKVFTKKNLTEFMLFIIQTFIKYVFTHKLHEIIMSPTNELLTTKIAFIDWIHLSV
jgi:hypothetical protein